MPRNSQILLACSVALHLRLGLLYDRRLGLGLLEIFQIGLELLRNLGWKLRLLGNCLDRIQVATGWHSFPSLRTNLWLGRWLAVWFQRFGGSWFDGWHCDWFFWLGHVLLIYSGYWGRLTSTEIVGELF